MPKACLFEAKVGRPNKMEKCKNDITNYMPNNNVNTKRSLWDYLIQMTISIPQKMLWIHKDNMLQRQFVFWGSMEGKSEKPEVLLGSKNGLEFRKIAHERC